MNVCLNTSWIAVILFVLMLSSAHAAEITVAAAANVQFTLKELADAFTRQTGIGVKPVVGSSGKLTSQVENGAPFDVFMSADMDFPERLFKDGLTQDAPQVYAYGSLVLWSMSGADLSQGVAGLAGPAFKKIALAAPKSAPYGRQSVNAMKHYHLYPAIAAKLVYGESVGQANQFITAKAVEAGFTAKSIVMAPDMQGKGVWVDVDPQAYEPIAQGVVVLKYAAKAHAGEARQFFEFLFSPAAKEILERYGYKVP